MGLILVIWLFFCARAKAYPAVTPTLRPQLRGSRGFRRGAATDPASFARTGDDGKTLQASNSAHP